MADSSPRLCDRVALRIEEAALLVGLSERSFRDHVLADPDCPRFYAGKSIRIPRRLFEQYVEKLADPDTRTDLGVD